VLDSIWRAAASSDQQATYVSLDQFVKAPHLTVDIASQRPTRRPDRGAAAIVRERLAQGRSAHGQFERCLCAKRRDSNEEDGGNREDVPHTPSDTLGTTHRVTSPPLCAAPQMRLSAQAVDDWR